MAFHNLGRLLRLPDLSAARIAWRRLTAIPPRRLAPLLVTAVALSGAAVIPRVPERMLVNAPAARARNPQYQGVRLLRDDYDRGIYAARGSFALQPGRRPYVDVRSEYPQLATYLFALPYLVVDTPEGHMTVFPLVTAAALGGAAFLMAGLTGWLGLSAGRVLLLLLPGTLYFSLNRFDPVPMLLTLLALGLLLKGRVVVAHVALAAGFLTKAYPLLYLPLLARFARDQGGVGHAARGAAAFLAVVVALSAHLALWSGPEAVLSSYVFQAGRMDNSQSLFHYVLEAVPMALEPVAGALFLVLQVGLAAAVVFWPLRSPQDVLRRSAAVTIAFVVFTRFQSPQWVVWITPLAALAARGGRELGLVVAQDLLAYAYFPLAYDRFGPSSPGLAFVVGSLTAARLILLGSLLLPARQRPEALGDAPPGVGLPSPRSKRGARSEFGRRY